MKYIKETIKYILRSRLFIQKYINEIERLYEMSPEELKRRNEEKFLQLFRLAYDHSSSTKNYMKRWEFKKMLSDV